MSKLMYQNIKIYFSPIYVNLFAYNKLGCYAIILLKFRENA